MPNMPKECLPTMSAASETQLNVVNGCSTTCLKKIVQHSDLHHARESFLKGKNEGSSAKERLSKVQRLTTCDLVKARTNCLGKDVLDLTKERRMEKQRALQDNLDGVRDGWVKILAAHSEFKEKEKAQCSRTVKEHEIVLRSLRKDKGEKTPKRKSDLIQLCQE